jgi:two-component system, NtrC family, response regulator GlrR
MQDFARFNLIGRSKPFLTALALIERFAASDHTVLIQGETGTGKELAARAIHYLGPRCRFPFIPVNCGAIPDALVESELFGHVRGAFTDAREAKPGIIAQARGGTLLLDEIEVMSARAQSALLRFLQDREYRPVGGTAYISSDVRVIGTTNADLLAISLNGTFRSDLRFRLNALPIPLPPLRERVGDLTILVEHMLQRLNRETSGPAKQLHPESRVTLSTHSWPGNVRELENLMLRHYLLERGSMIRITAGELEVRLSEPSQTTNSLDDVFKNAKARAVAAFEQAYVTALLIRSGGNLSLASRLSGKDRSDLSKLLRKYGIQRGQFGVSASAVSEDNWARSKLARMN